MKAQTRVIAMDHLTNTGEKSSQETLQQTSSWTLVPGDVLGRILRNRSVRFVGHSFEMVVAMMVGMPLLALIEAILSPAIPIIETRVVSSLLMGIFMAVTMSAWMRCRSHTWRHIAEMNAAMLLPAGALVAIGMYGPAHAATVLGMLGLMLYRRREYLDERCHDLSQKGSGRS